jgi:cyclophilin family peptidyl-prolyl cis-trans isomerase
MKRLLLCLALLAFTTAAAPPPAPKTEEVGVLKTSLGTMVFRFYEKDAPLTTAHIKKLIRDGFFDGKIFYRVVKGHVIQAGDGEGTAGPKVKGEFNDHPFVAGTVGLARDTDPDSGSTEIFICHAARPHLDGKYSAFGQLIEGQDVLEKIANVPVDEQFIDKVAFHKPKQPVVIEKATLEERPLGQ